MATTGLQAFELACALIDEVLPNGTISESDIADYKGKAPRLLTMCVTEIGAYENVATEVITDLSQDLVISDKLSRTAVPYFLAYNFLASENLDNPYLVELFKKEYERLKKVPTTMEAITYVYDCRW